MKLNLIDVTDETGRYRRADAEELAAFRDALDALGVPVVPPLLGRRRHRRRLRHAGRDRAAAAALLAGDAPHRRGSRSARRAGALSGGGAWPSSQTSCRPPSSLPVSAAKIRSASAGATLR